MAVCVHISYLMQKKLSKQYQSNEKSKDGLGKKGEETLL